MCKYEKFCLEGCCVASYNEHVKPLGKKEMNFKRRPPNINNVSLNYLFTDWIPVLVAKLFFFAPHRKKISFPRIFGTFQGTETAPSKSVQCWHKSCYQLFFYSSSPLLFLHTHIFPAPYVNALLKFAISFTFI